MWRWCGQSTELNESKPTSNFPNIMRAANDEDDGDNDIGNDDGNEADTEDCVLVDKSDIHQYGANCVDPRH